MIQKSVLLIALSALTACVSDSASQSPALEKLQVACNAGDTTACKSVVDIEQRERERISEMWFGE